MKNDIVICLFCLTGCIADQSIRSTESVVTLMLNDIVNDGISIFDYQKEFLSKSDWEVLMVERLLTLNELQSVMSVTEVTALAQTGSQVKFAREIDFTKVSVPNLDIQPIEFIDSNIKHQWTSQLMKENSEVLFLVSEICVSSDMEDSDLLHAFVYIFWPGNLRVVYYKLREANDGIVIHDRKLLEY